MSEDSQKLNTKDGFTKGHRKVGGRKKGTPNRFPPGYNDPEVVELRRRTLEEWKERFKNGDGLLEPLDYFMYVLNCEHFSTAERMEAAKAALQYKHSPMPKVVEKHETKRVSVEIQTAADRLKNLVEVQVLDVDTDVTEPIPPPAKSLSDRRFEEQEAEFHAETRRMGNREFISKFQERIEAMKKRREEGE